MQPRSISESWEAVRNWYSTRAPEGEIELNQGVTDDEWNEVECQLGFGLPEDVKLSYRLHDGSQERGIFEFGSYLMSLHEAFGHWQNWRDVLATGEFSGLVTCPEGPIKPEVWRREWFPITHSGAGDHHCIDMAPAEGGTLGQVIFVSHEEGPKFVESSSMAEWLSSFATELQDGVFEYDSFERQLMRV